MKSISVLGASGSIGKSLADIVLQNKDSLRIVAFSVYKNAAEAIRQIELFHPKLVAVADDKTRQEIKSVIKDKKLEIVTGTEGLIAVAEFDCADIVVSAVVGSVGLVPLLCAIKKKKTIATANKEALVMAGDIIMQEAKKNNVKIIPVDSEHSAIFQALNGENRKNLKKILLTASGGPFKDKSKEEMKFITPAQAIRHPRWNMGAKISVNSSTLMNKGLEVIEAKWLFDTRVENIEVVIHPESIIHSMVEFVDNSIIAQLSQPDMRIAIQYALTYPDRSACNVESLDLTKLKILNFGKPDFEKFPCLKLAIEAGKKNDSSAAVLNAANEEAVQAFMDSKICFTDIVRVVSEVLDQTSFVTNYSLEEIIEIDKKARRMAGQICLASQRV